MSMFTSQEKKITRQKTDPEGTPVNAPDGSPIMETISVPRWSTEATITYLRHRGRELAQSACRDGWHINLIDFVQHQHRLPNSDECDALYVDFQKIENATQNSGRRRSILEKRANVKDELLKPLEAKAVE